MRLRDYQRQWDRAESAEYVIFFVVLFILLGAIGVSRVQPMVKEALAALSGLLH